MTAPRWLRRVDWMGLGVDAAMIALTTFLAPPLATALFIILASRR